jgi:hypothetical protein
MKKNSFTLTLVGCESGDWQGLYINDQLFAEGHSVDIIQSLKDHISEGGSQYLDCSKIEIITVSDFWLQEESRSSFPFYFNEIPEKGKV